MKRKIKLGLVAVMLLLFAGIASAGDLPPPIPADYSGNVIVNGAPNGSKVLAQVVNVTDYVYQTSIFDIVSGRYGKLVNGNPLLVAPPDETFNGKTIKFYVKTDGKYCKANQEDTFSQGKTENSFNLTVTGPSCVEPLGTIKDTTAPVITILGTNPVSVQVGSVYTDAGATAFDNYDGNITASIVTVNPVNTTVKGTYTVTYNVKDSSNNAAVQVTRTVNVVTTTPADNSRSSSSSSGGSGGGGVISGEPFANIAKSETRDGSLYAGKLVAFNFNLSELAIRQILITGKENENDVTVRVESLKNTSKLVSRPAPGTVYQNTNVWANSKKITAVTLKFRVTNAWITGSNVQKETIKLLRWSDNDWKALDTTVLNSDDTYTYFEAQSAGLSSFAVSAVREEDLVSSSPTTPSSVATPPATNTSTPKKPTPGFGVLAAVFVVSAIYLLRRREG